MSERDREMKHIILGTAGHVDHGKTALIKAITGVDTDRLREEKERGITIELGFASLTVEGGERLGVIDVPGHEKFVRHMVSGATGIDLVLLVIAADEGIMPQTREHVDICSLLGVRHGVVALTKIDLVDKEWLSLVSEDVRMFLKGTFLEEAPIVPFSSVSGEGLSELVSVIGDIAAKVSERRDSGLFRLPMDRVFTMKGFGTVVTGTLISGQVKVGETVEILPKRVPTKVRGIQVHGESMELADAGQRTAVNLQGIERDVCERGNVLVHPGIFHPSNRMDVFFRYLPASEKKLKNRALVRFHTGTCEIMARVILPREEIEPGEQVPAQLLLESPTVVMGGDRFVIRSYSPVRTIGGGEILDPVADKRRKIHSAVSDEREILYSGTDEAKIFLLVERSGFNGIALSRLSVRTGRSVCDLGRVLDRLVEREDIVVLEKGETRMISRSVYRTLCERILNAIETYHEKYPLKEGIQKEELKSTVGSHLDPRLFNMALKALEKEGRIAAERDSVRMAGRRVDLGGRLEDLKEQIDEIYRKSKLTPPSAREVVERCGDRKSDAESVMQLMLREGTLLKIAEDMYFHRDAVKKLKEDYTEELLKEGKATPSSFKKLTGLSRKYIIPLMEYFDTVKLTIRVGDHRTLRDHRPGS